MNRMLLILIATLSLMGGCATSSAVKTVEHGPPLRAFAAETAREFQIPASDAPTALNTFSRQANTQVLFDYNALRVRQTRAVEGTLPPSVALTSLLKDTGLVARDVNERTVAITPDPSSHAIH